MKKPILMIADGMVAVSLIWTVDKTFLAKESAPKTADKQEESAVARQGSATTPKKPADKPTSKPPVYDLSKKAHWYAPETTIGFWSSSRTLAEWIEPFQPTAEEFRLIAQYETEFKENSMNLLPKTSTTPWREDDGSLIKP